jgi:hypothetical protein
MFLMMIIIIIIIIIIWGWVLRYGNHFFGNIDRS